MRLSICVLSVALLTSLAAGQEIPNAPAVPQGDYVEVWPDYLVIPWSYKTPPLNDATAKAFREQGINAVHADKLIKPDKAQWVRQHRFPFYLDHTAGKGYLFLRYQLGKSLIGKNPPKEYQAGNGLVARPECLHDPKVIGATEKLVRDYVAAAKPLGSVFYSLDDEISTGSFVSPVETCWAEPCRPVFRKFALGLYGGSLDRLNAAWGTRFASEDEITPATAGYAVAQAGKLAPDQWNFARWADFRQFMDQTQAETLARLTRLCNQLDPGKPCGFEGGQQPSAYGGYDYSRLSRSVQWIEAYNIGGNNEIVRSLAPRVVRSKTFFSSRNKARDSHRLWYHFVHGDRGVILWPAWGEQSWWDEKAQLDPAAAHLPPLFREMTGKRMAGLLTAARFVDDGVAIYYSQPSIRAGWIMDASVHGESWPGRSGGVDRYTGSSLLVRHAWMAMLEDQALQYNFVDAPMLVAGEVSYPRYKVLILPAVHALGDAEATAIRKFVEAGGTVIADYLPGILDEHCRSRGGKGALDDLFGVSHQWDKGLFAGKFPTWLNGEAYREPVAQRFFPAKTVNTWAIAESGLRGEPIDASTFKDQPVYLGRTVGKGRAVLLNLSPIPYVMLRYTDKTGGHEMTIKSLCEQAGARPAVQIDQPNVEALRWRKGGRAYLCVVANPHSVFDGNEHEAAVTALLSETPRKLELQVRGAAPAEVVNERTGAKVTPAAAGDRWRISDTWTPCEAAIYSYPAGR